MIKITKTKDHLLIKVLATKIKNYVEKEQSGVSPDIIIRWVRANLLNPFMAIWIAQEEENIVGFCIANIQQLLDKEILNIVQLDGNTPEIEKEILDVVSKWAKDYSIKTLSIITKKPDRWSGLDFNMSEFQMTKEL
jgi:hypothetical protein